MIRVTGVSKAYGDHPVLDDVSLEVRRGERVAVLGTNGSGKTTLFRAMLGLTGFDGAIEIEGSAVGPEARARLGYVPQRPPIARLTLTEFVALFGALRATPTARIEALLGTFGLSLHTDGSKQLAELSGGMLQKALLAVALGSDVPALLLDEPTANLDPVAREDFLAALARVGDETTILLASHRISEVEAVAERIVVLHRGSVAFDGPISALRGQTGAVGRLWVELPPERHNEAVRVLETISGAGPVHSNGRGVWIDASPASRGRIVSALGEAGLEPGDLRVVDEPLTALLGRLGSEGDHD